MCIRDRAWRAYDADGNLLAKGTYSPPVGTGEYDVTNFNLLGQAQFDAGSVSYTHLDVYKRQVVVAFVTLHVVVGGGGQLQVDCLLYTSSCV